MNIDNIVCTRNNANTQIPVYGNVINSMESADKMLSMFELPPSSSRAFAYVRRQRSPLDGVDLESRPEEVVVDATSVVVAAGDLAESESDFYDTDLELSDAVDSVSVGLKLPRGLQQKRQQRRQRRQLEMKKVQQQQQQQQDAAKDAADEPESKCVRAYRTACKRDSVEPQVAVVRGLQQTELNVRHRCLGDGDAHALSVALCKNSSVTRLELGGNNIGALGVLYLKSVLTHNSTITYLDISENDLGRLPASAVAIADILRTNIHLETLVLAGNNLRDQEAVYLAAGIASNSHLVRLDLSHNLIGETGGIHLGRAFATNNGIDVLDVSWNNIRQKGAVALCRGLQENGYVTKLNVAWNGFGYEGALAVGELLKVNETLTELDLSSNRINWQGIQFIAAGLSKNRALEILKLDSNPLTTTGGMDLIESIAVPDSTVVNLSLKGVPVIGDFELMTMMIRQVRPNFICRHGGIVRSHDVIGQRLDKQLTPIQKVIKFMKDREYRPTELFRMLDKDVANKMTNEELARRLRRVGVHLLTYEVDELMEFINSSNTAQREPSTIVDFQAMARGVKGQQELERQEKIREQQRDRELRRYHRNILAATDDVTAAAILPPIDTAAVDDPSNPNGSFMSILMGGTSQLSIASQSSLPVRPGNLMSMSTALGAKVKQFGKAVPPSRKTKKKNKNKKTKSSSAVKEGRRKNMYTTDYETNGAMF